MGGVVRGVDPSLGQTRMNYEIRPLPHWGLKTTTERKGEIHRCLNQNWLKSFQKYTISVVLYMMGVTLLGVVLIFLSIGLNIQTVESCSCFPLHPQHQFCNSELGTLNLKSTLYLQLTFSEAAQHIYLKGTLYFSWFVIY